MILQEVKAYIRERRQVSLRDISLHFDTDPDTLKGMLDFLERKGRIRALRNDAACAGACHCDIKDEQVLYCWNPSFANIAVEVPLPGSGKY